MTKLSRRFDSILLPLLLSLLWQVSCSAGLVDHLFLPTPLDVVRACFHGLYHSTLAMDLAITTLRALAGFLLSALIAVPFGFLVGRVTRLATIIHPTLDFFRSIPVTAMFPLFMFVLGVGNASKIGMVVFASALIVFLSTTTAAMGVSNHRILTAKLMGGSMLQVFFKVMLPDCLPGIISGLRIALSMSLIIVVVSEMFIGTQNGIGKYIIDSQVLYQIPEMYAGIFLAGLTGYFFNLLLRVIEMRVSYKR